MAYQTLQQEYLQIPVVTRAYTTACVLTTAAVVRKGKPVAVVVARVVRLLAGLLLWGAAAVRGGTCPSLLLWGFSGTFRPALRWLLPLSLARCSLTEPP